MQLLDTAQIRQKIRRLAIEILERNYGESELVLLGINANGSAFAQLLREAIAEQSPVAIRSGSIHISPADPLGGPVSLGLPVGELAGKALIVCDDVANTGRTLFYAMRPLMDVPAKKIEVAVLVDRNHKSFPIQPDYFGLALATTLQENIAVRLSEGAFLE
jgi:pyrimidine operon attenuation protein/uracil phosphoribosyltransferase